MSLSLGKRKVDELGKEWEIGNSCLVTLIFPAKWDSEPLLRGRAPQRAKERGLPSLSSHRRLWSVGGKSSLVDMLRCFRQQLCFGDPLVSFPALLSCSMALDEVRTLSFPVKGPF